jgi:hypothetical protein
LLGADLPSLPQAKSKKQNHTFLPKIFAPKAKSSIKLGTLLSIVNQF